MEKLRICESGVMVGICKGFWGLAMGRTMEETELLLGERRTISDFIDYVRDNVPPELQKLVAVRQALRCLPIVFSHHDEIFWLENCRKTITALADVLPGSNEDRTVQRFVGRLDVKPPSAANASVSITQAFRAVCQSTRNAELVSRCVELCIADSFDMLRDVHLEMRNSPNLTFEVSQRDLQVHRNAFAVLVADDVRNAHDYDEGFVLSEPLWSARSPKPQILQESGLDFRRAADAWPATWGFWHRWYQSLEAGDAAYFPIENEIASIANEVWSEGPEAVAKAIQEIEVKHAEQLDRPDSVPELHRQKLLAHVQRLLASPDMTALAAEGAASTLERAIAQYITEAPANCLPDALAHLESVPPLFRRIAATVKGAGRAEAKASKLAEDIEELNAKIARLEADLRDARAKTVHGLFTQSALRAAGTAFGAGLVGSLGLAVGHFFGEWPSDLTLENLRGWTSDLSMAEPKPDAANLPPSYEA